MLSSEFSLQFKEHINTLSFEEALNLALAVCRKLFPDYAAFVQEEKWGNVDTPIDAIALCMAAQKVNVDPHQLEDAISNVGLITPDTKDFSGVNVSYALNAVVSVLETLQYIVDRNPIHIFYVGECLTDTVDFKIQEQKGFDPERVTEHPMMVEARRFLFEGV